MDPDGPQRSCFEILAPSHKVENQRYDGIIEKPIDGKIASLRVPLRAAEGHALRVAAVLVDAIGAKGGHLIFASVLDNQNDSELRAHEHRPGKQRLHLLRAGRCGDVEIMGSLAHQGIANATARVERLMAGSTKTADDPQGRRFHNL
jgi:hypothetical protein